MNIEKIQLGHYTGEEEDDGNDGGEEIFRGVYCNSTDWHSIGRAKSWIRQKRFKIKKAVVFIDEEGRTQIIKEA